MRARYTAIKIFVRYGTACSIYTFRRYAREREKARRACTEREREREIERQKDRERERERDKKRNHSTRNSLSLPIHTLSAFSSVFHNFILIYCFQACARLRALLTCTHTHTHTVSLSLSQTPAHAMISPSLSTT